MTEQVEQQETKLTGEKLLTIDANDRENFYNDEKTRIQSYDEMKRIEEAWLRDRPYHNFESGLSYWAKTMPDADENLIKMCLEWEFNRPHGLYEEERKKVFSSKKSRRKHK